MHACAWLCQVIPCLGVLINTSSHEKFWCHLWNVDSWTGLLGLCTSCLHIRVSRGAQMHKQHSPPFCTFLLLEVPGLRCMPFPLHLGLACILIHAWDCSLDGTLANFAKLREHNLSGLQIHGFMGLKNSGWRNSVSMLESMLALSTGMMSWVVGTSTAELPAGIAADCVISSRTVSLSR